VRALGAIAPAALALALGAEVSRGADGAFPIATSPRAAGRGGADVAVGDDAFTVSVNPAAMTSFPGTRIDLTAAFYTAQVSYTNGMNHGRAEQGFPVPAPALGCVQGFGSDDETEHPFQLGMVLEPVSGGGGSALFRTPIFPWGERERSNLIVLGLTFACAVKVNERVSIGAGLTGLAVSLDQKGLVGSSGGMSSGLVRNFTNGALDAQDPYFRVNGVPASWNQVAASAPGSFSSAIVDVQGARGWGAGGVLGVVVRVVDQLSLGFAYKTPGFITPLVGRATVDASASGSAASGPLDAIQTNFLARHLPDGGQHLVSSFHARIRGLEMPQTAAIGAAFRPHERVLLALDLKWIDWRSAFDRISVTLSRGTGRDLAEITSNQSGGPLESKVLLRWHEQFVVAVGGAIAPVDWLRLRAGYNYGGDPIPRRTEGPFTPATVEHHLTLGVGVDLGMVTLDAAWVHAFPKSTTIRGSGVSSDYEGIRHKADQDAFLVGAGIEF
jgi:long-subunit fatty acid transport protein